MAARPVLAAALVATFAAAAAPRYTAADTRGPAAGTRVTVAADGVRSQAPFVPDSFAVPRSYEGADYVLRPLGPDLVDQDYAAYMGSIEHIRRTFGGGKWPSPGITRAEALKDVEGEKARFDARESFTYAVLSKDGTRELGCVYISPARTPGHDARVRTWVVESRAAFEPALRNDIKAWLAAAWPFRNVEWP